MGGTSKPAKHPCMTSLTSKLHCATLMMPQSQLRGHKCNAVSSTQKIEPGCLTGGLIWSRASNADRTSNSSRGKVLTTRSDHAATERRMRERSSPSFHLVSGGSSRSYAMEKGV